MTGRPLRAVLLAVAAASLLVTAGCSSSSGAGSRPSDSFQATLDREAELYPLFVRCLASHDVPIWDRAQGKLSVAPPGATEGWYRNGRVSRNEAFVSWLRQNSGTYPLSPAFKPYKTIDQWVAAAAAKGTWPAKVCGPLPHV